MSPSLVPFNLAASHHLDLSEEQIDRLLSNAEQRLQAKSDVQSQERQHALEGSDDATESSMTLGRLSATTDTEPSFKFPKLNPGLMPAPYVRSSGEIATGDVAKLVSSEDRRLARQSRRVEDPVLIKEKTDQVKKATAGSDWFDMPRTNLTSELKRDLQLLQMRSVLDPKRHYKKTSSKKLAVPEYSQVGTIVAGPTDFYSSRIPNKERKQTFVEEILSRKDSVSRFTSQYNDVQRAKTSGKKAHYKKLIAKRGSKKVRP